VLERVLLDDAWNEIFDIDDVNVCTEAFTLVMQYIMDVLIPLRRKRIKQTCSPWNHDPDITIARHRRDWLHRRALKSGNSEDWIRYKKCRNQVTALTRSAKGRYLSLLACNLSDNPFKFWRNFKHLSARQKVQRGGGALDLDIESINQHFLTVAQKTINDVPLSVTSPLSYISVSDVPDIQLNEIDEGEVYRHICDLNIHKAVGQITFLLSLLKPHRVVWLCFLLNLFTKVVDPIHFLMFGRML